MVIIPGKGIVFLVEGEEEGDGDFEQADVWGEYVFNLWVMGLIDVRVLLGRRLYGPALGWWWYASTIHTHYVANLARHRNTLTDKSCLSERAKYGRLHLPAYTETHVLNKPD